MNSSNNSGQNAPYGIALSVIVCSSVAACVVAVLLVLVFRLYRRVVYRLALYQVLASLAFAAIEISQMVVAVKDSPAGCVTVGYLTLYAQWMKLLFTAWVTLHIFCFGVFHRTLKLEPLYVATSLIVPAIVSSVPLVTGTYGPMLVDGKASLCYIFANGTSEGSNETSLVATVERLVLWDVPALLTLFAASAAMLLMVCRLTNTVCLWRSKYALLEDGEKFRKALRQLLPLAAFPFLFFVFIIPQLALNVFLATTPSANKDLFFVAIACISVWSLASGLTLTVHICLVKCFPVMKKKNTPENVSLYTRESSTDRYS